ncbi:mucin-2-like [Neocloeon triangulifer]|uniref:mucin-2-like n=1 Tax=Neocloeon triangulifer TaxID=2078957 RepID=UPI00286EDFCA|nr:mucin-2-like [Neocloeon triangulifer]
MQAAKRAAAALLLCSSLLHNVIAFPAASLMEQELDGDDTRKVLGSSVVTSVSVIMDLGNGSQTYADPTGRPVDKPASASHLSSPPSLMSPDRYEFYTFNDAGDLVKRMMTMDEIQGLIAGESVEIGSDLPGMDPQDVEPLEERPTSFFLLPRPLERNPDWSPPGVDKVIKKVQDVLADVQNRITIEESSHVPHWGINRPNIPNTPLHATQNIPGSTLHLLKDTPEKVSTFVPPVFTTSKPTEEEIEQVAEIAPSSTPTLAPVSATIEISSTLPENLVKVSTEMPQKSTEPPSVAPILKTTTRIPPEEASFIPVFQVKPDVDQPAITIPSTIIADLLVEDMYEKIKHTEQDATSKPVQVEERTSTTSAASSTSPSTVTSSTSPKPISTTQKIPPPTTFASSTRPKPISTTQTAQPSIIVASSTSPKPVSTTQRIPPSTTQKATTVELETPQKTTSKPLPTMVKVETQTRVAIKTTESATKPTTAALMQKISSTTESLRTQASSTTSSPAKPVTSATTIESFNITEPSSTKAPSTALPNSQSISGFYLTTHITPTEAPKTTTQAPVKVNVSNVMFPNMVASDSVLTSAAPVQLKQNTNVPITAPTTSAPSKVTVQTTSPSKITIPTTSAPSKVTVQTTSTSKITIPTTKTPVKVTTEVVPAPVFDAQPESDYADFIALPTETTRRPATSTPNVPEKLTEKTTSSPIVTTVSTTPTKQVFTQKPVNIPKITLPPFDDLKIQMDQITQSLTDKKPTLLQQTDKRPIVSSFSSTTVAFGSSAGPVQTGKTTVPPKVTSQVYTTMKPSTTTSQPTTSTTEAFTESVIFETQMTTVNEPPVADNLVMEDITSKSSDFELTSEVSGIEADATESNFDGIENDFSEQESDEEEENFESTERIETDDEVPFLSQIFDDVSTSQSSEEEEDVKITTSLPVKTTVKPTTTQSTSTVAPETTTTQKLFINTNKTPPTNTPLYESPRTETPTTKIPTTRAPITTTTSLKVTSPASSTTKIITTSAKVQPQLKATQAPPASSTVGKVTVSPSSGFGSSQSNTQTTKLASSTSPVTKTTNPPANADDSSTEEMELVSTTEYVVSPTTIKHASTIKLDTSKGPGASSMQPVVNKLDREKIKEVLDQILDTAGILNLGDSSEEAVREEIYTTFIPASTTVKNTSPQPAKNTTFPNKIQTTLTKPTKNQTIPVTTTEKQTLVTENITDLEVSWQEPPEVIWTAEKNASSNKKPPVKQATTTTVAPTKKPTDKEPTTLTKSNDDGMELIASSDKIRPSTPSMRPRPKPYADSAPPVELKAASINNLGLEATTVTLDEDVRRFIDLSNDIGIRLYKHTTSDLDKRRSIAISPFGATSLIAMVFIGARGQTSAQINDFLPFDDMITFNPHLVMRNITDSVIMSPDLHSAAIVRELYSQKGSKEPLDFYKARASAFYDGLMQQVDFEDIAKVVRVRTNELVKTQTSNKVPLFLGDAAVLRLNPPFAALSANVFQMDCTLSTSAGRDGEMTFHGEKNEHVLPAAVWSGEFMIGYDVGLDATAVEIPHSNSPTGALTSTVFVMPGKPGTNSFAGVPLLARLEARLISRRAWSGLLRNLQRSEHAIDVQVPRFEHRSVLNLTVPLSRMGLKDVFVEGKADLRGVNGIQELYLSDISQMNVFSLCSTPDAEGHVETYPSSKRTGRLGSRGGEDYEDDYDWRTGSLLKVPLPLRPRQARLPASENSRLKIDRPFLYFIRHNPTGMILHIGRFNPRDEP